MLAPDGVSVARLAAARFLTDEIERLIRKGHTKKADVCDQHRDIKYREFSNKIVPLRD
jgi:hypothetical protein